MLDRRGLAVMAAVAMLLVGCSDSSSDDPAPTTTAAESAEAESAAPKVPAPLTVTAIQSDACAALSSAQLSKLGLGSGESRPGSVGPSCTFLEADDPSNQIDITTVTANKNGLADVYATKANDDYFEPTEIAGYPAVYAASLDHRAQGKCGLFVGVTDQLTVNILAQFDHGTGATDPCPVVAQVAEAVIETLG